MNERECMNGMDTYYECVALRSFFFGVLLLFSNVWAIFTAQVRVPHGFIFIVIVARRQ